VARHEYDGAAIPPVNPGTWQFCVNVENRSESTRVVHLRNNRLPIGVSHQLKNHRYFGQSRN
jgi:hypothetical protein